LAILVVRPSLARARRALIMGSSTSVVTGPVAGDWEASSGLRSEKADLAFVLGELELLGVLRRQHQRHHGDFGGARVDRLPRPVSGGRWRALSRFAGWWRWWLRPWSRAGEKHVHARARLNQPGDAGEVGDLHGHRAQAASMVEENALDGGGAESLELSTGSLELMATRSTRLMAFGCLETPRPWNVASG